MCFYSSFLFFIVATLVYIFLVYLNFYSKYIYQKAFKNLVLSFFLVNFLFFTYYVYSFFFVYRASAPGAVSQLLANTSMQNVVLLNVVGFIVIYLCYLVGAVSLAVLGDRFWSNTKGLPLAFLYFPLIVSMLCSSLSFFTLFISYELLLVPSLFVVYRSCYTRRAQQANIYFFV